MKPSCIIIALLCLHKGSLVGDISQPSREGQEGASFSIVSATANDWSDFTAGVAWGLTWVHGFAFHSRDLPVRPGAHYQTSASWNFDASANTTGALLINDALNRTPIVADLGFGAGFQLSNSRINAIPPVDVEDPGAWMREHNSKHIPKPLWHIYRIELGGALRWETDQSHSYSIAAGSGYLAAVHSYTESWHALSPSIWVYLDAANVERQNVQTIGAQSASSFFRSRVAAQWRLSGGILQTDQGWINRSSLSFGGQYSRDYGQSASWKASGLDEAFGWFFELQHRLPKCIVPRGDSAQLYLRTTGGRIAPVYEDDRTVLLGIRYLF